MFPRHRTCVLLAALTVPLLLGGKGCDDSHQAMDEVIAIPITPNTCEPSDCPPKPYTPTVVCADGTLGGYGTCRRLADDTCGYLFRACAEVDAGKIEDAALPMDAMSAPDAAVPSEPDAAVSEPDASSLRRCGTRGSAKCEVGQFCNYAPESSCGSNDVGGVCQPFSAACSDGAKPVCGCDARSYPSACHANALGVSVLHDGLCTPLECKMAGGVASYGDTTKPPQCPRDTVQWDLAEGGQQAVCCVAKPTLGQSCGGFVGGPCPTGQWCNYGQEAGGQGCGGVADGTGTCQPIQQECAMEYTPVCGCDRRTYETRCAASAHQMALLHDGPCTDDECTKQGGELAFGTGAAPMCPRGSVSYGAVAIALVPRPIEGAICCVKVE